MTARAALLPCPASATRAMPTTKATTMNRISRNRGPGVSPVKPAAASHSSIAVCRQRQRVPQA